jgi:hypothetical protein
MESCLNSDCKIYEKLPEFTHLLFGPGSPTYHDLAHLCVELAQSNQLWFREAEKGHGDAYSLEHWRALAEKMDKQAMSDRAVLDALELAQQSRALAADLDRKLADALTKLADCEHRHTLSRHRT